MRASSTASSASWLCLPHAVKAAASPFWKTTSQLSTLSGTHSALYVGWVITLASINNVCCVWQTFAWCLATLGKIPEFNSRPVCYVCSSHSFSLSESRVGWRHYRIYVLYVSYCNKFHENTKTTKNWPYKKFVCVAKTWYRLFFCFTNRRPHCCLGWHVPSLTWKWTLPFISSQCHIHSQGAENTANTTIVHQMCIHLQLK